MSNGSVYLNGSEDVRRAASSISGASEDMRQAANFMSEAAVLFKQALEQHAGQMRDILEEHRQEMAKMLKPAMVLQDTSGPAITLQEGINFTKFVQSVTETQATTAVMTDCPYCLVPEGRLHLVGCSRPRTPE